MTVYLLPIIFVVLLVVCLIKRVQVYDCFLQGAKDSVSLVVDIFPYVATVFVAIELFKASGLSQMLSNALSVPLSYLGIPKEICEVMLLSPLSGNGTIALFEGVVTTYGVDSYPARCAAVVAAGSETIFYVAAIYFSTRKIKKLRYAIPVSLFCTLLCTIIGCALCRVM